MDTIIILAITLVIALVTFSYLVASAAWHNGFRAGYAEAKLDLEDDKRWQK